MGMLLDNLFGFPRTAVQRSYNWDLIMPDVWTSTVLGVVVSKYCQNITFGNYNMADISAMKVGVFSKFFAGSLDIKKPVATFIAPVPDVVSNYFHVWKKLIIDDDGYYHKSLNYKKNLYIVLYDRTGIPANMISLVGVFPKTFPEWNLAYTSEDIVKYNIEFSVDKITTGLSAFGSAISSAKNAISSIGGLF